jgi:hypothetical protein
MRQIEAMIRAEPGQWFWYNRRWVLDPLDAEEPAGEFAEEAPDADHSTPPQETP